MMADGVTYRASGVGGCPKHLAYRRLSYDMEPPPAHKQRIFDSANEQEGEALQWLVDTDGGVVSGEQQETVWDLTLATGRISIVGHIDGLWYPPGDSESRWLVEVKAMSLGRFSTVRGDGLRTLGGLDSFESYQQQIVSYWLGLGGEENLSGAIFLVKLWQQDEYIKVNLDPLLMDVLIEKWAPIICGKIVMVEKAIAAGQIPDVEDPGEFGCETCEARFHCHPEWLEEERVKADDFSGDFTEDDLAAFEKYTRAQKLEAKVKELKGEASEHFTSRLAVLNTRKLVIAGKGNVQRVESTSKRLDKKALVRKVGQEIVDECTTESTSTDIRFYPEKGE